MTDEAIDNLMAVIDKLIDGRIQQQIFSNPNWGASFNEEIKLEFRESVKSVLAPSK